MERILPGLGNISGRNNVEPLRNEEKGPGANHLHERLPESKDNAPSLAGRATSCGDCGSCCGPILEMLLKVVMRVVSQVLRVLYSCVSGAADAKKVESALSEIDLFLHNSKAADGDFSKLLPDNHTAKDPDLSALFRELVESQTGEDMSIVSRWLLISYFQGDIKVLPEFLLKKKDSHNELNLSSQVAVLDAHFFWQLTALQQQAVKENCFGTGEALPAGPARAFLRSIDTFISEHVMQGNEIFNRTYVPAAANWTPANLGQDGAESR